MTDIDYYRVLGVPPTATKRAIKVAYLDLVRRLHPDRVGPEGTALFQQIAEAYEHLSDPEKRHAYDRSRASRNTHTPTRPKQSEAWADPNPLADRPTPVRHVTEKAFGRQGSTQDLEFEVALTPWEAWHGVELPLVLPVIADCPWCGGLGQTLLPCLRCRGRGVTVRQRVLRIQIPSNVYDGTVMELPLGDARFGWRLLRLHISVQQGYTQH